MSKPANRTRRSAAVAATKAARVWASANLPGYATTELKLALRTVEAHPDAHSVGYSQARQARERLEAELAARQQP